MQSNFVGMIAQRQDTSVPSATSRTDSACAKQSRLAAELGLNDGFNMI